MRARPRAAFGIYSAIESDATTHRTPKALSCQNLGARALPGKRAAGVARPRLRYELSPINPPLPTYGRGGGVGRGLGAGEVLIGVGVGVGVGLPHPVGM